MIENIRLRNFQKHGDLLIELDPHVTCITAESDAGKSSVIRALRWIATNRPNGNAFLKWGKKFTRVEVTVDGKAVKRSRGKRNVYSVDGKEFIAFGQGVPHEVEDLLNLSAVNFQGQHDPVFWFTLPPSDVGRELNAVVNLQLIDKASSSISVERHRCKEKVKFCEERISALKLKEMSLNWVVQASEDWEDVERLRGVRDSITADRSELASTLSEYEKASDTHESLHRVLDDGRIVLEGCSEFLQGVEKTDTLRELVASYRLHEEAASSKVVGDFARLKFLRERRADLEKRNAGLSSLIQEYREHEDTRCRSEGSSIRLEGELETMKEGQECPTCGRPFPRTRK